MQSKFLKRTLSVLLAVAMVVALASGSILTSSKVNASDGKRNVSYTKVANNGSGLYFATKEAAENFEKAYVKDGMVRVSIVLEDKSVLAKGFSTKNIAANTDAVNYSKSLRVKQDAIAEKISKNVLNGEKLDVVWNITMAGNIISANVPYNKIEAIRKIMGVKDVVVEAQYELYSDEANMATASVMTGTPAVWSEGYTGAGSIVAIIDTGLDVEHELFDEAAFEYAIDETGKDVVLLSVEDIDKVLSLLHITGNGRLANATAEDFFISSKLPFAANYVDNDFDVSHMEDLEGEHGSHVTGIAAGNRYVSDGNGGFVKAADAVGVQGQAPDAQVLVMKVFGKNGGAYDSDYVVAIEDAITLGADAVNLSLGSAVAGFATSDEYQDIFDSFTDTDTVVVISSGNNSYWAEKTVYGHLYNDDVNFATNGSPGSFASPLTVASVDNGGYCWIELAGYTFLTNESVGYGNDLFSTLAGTQEYVFLYPESGTYVDEESGKTVTGLVHGYGSEEELESIADIVEGKIAVITRGRTSFYQKINAAAAAGAIGVIIVNNQPGTLGMNLSGINTTIPAVSVTQDVAEYLFYAADGYDLASDGLIYLTGTLEVGFTIEDFITSSFSSWGVPGDLSLKPEISAPGGNILSVNGDHVFKVYDEDGYFIGYDVLEGHNNYELMSGTSMAAPQITGLVAVMSEFIRETGLDEKTGMSARALSNSLLMSTATAGKDLYNEYYPVMQQGAGLANIEKATSAKSFITIDKVAETAPISAAEAIADGKVKIELGAIQSDSFQAEFSIHNFSDENVEYYLFADFFTQAIDEYFRYTSIDYVFPGLEWTVNGEAYESIDPNMYDFNGDGVVNSLDAQQILECLVNVSADLNGLDEYADFDGDKDIDSYDARLAYSALCGTTVSVKAGETMKVVLTVSGLEEIYTYDEYGLSGNYIEGYIFAREGDSEDGALGVLHSIPVFGFWGDWSAYSMFDRANYEISELYDEAEYYPYMYYEYAKNNGQGLSPFDTQAFLVKYPGDSELYFLGGNPLIPDEVYMPERNAINSQTSIKSVLFSLIRNAGATRFFVNNKYGRTVAQIELGAGYAAYYNPNNGHWGNTYYNAAVNYLAKAFKNDDLFTIYMQAIPEYYLDAKGEADWNAVDLDKTSYSMSLVLDDEVPFIVGAVYDEQTTDLVLSAHDNQYISAVVLYTEDGILLDYYGSAADIRKGEQIDYLFNLEELFEGEEIAPHLLIEVYDYALNLSTYKINLNTEELEDPELSVVVDPKVATIINNGSVQLSASVYPWGYEDETVFWESSDTSVVVVDENGLVQSVYAGEEDFATATVTARSAVDETKFDTTDIIVIVAHKDLNGVIWDEKGDVWVSSFDIATIPEYKALSEQSLNLPIASLAYASDGTLYAASYENETYTSDFYIVDPESWTFTKIGTSEYGYGDICAAPVLGDDVMYAIYGPYIFAVDTSTGTFFDYFNFGRYIAGSAFVGLTYDECYYDEEEDCWYDYLLAVDTEGYLYSIGLYWEEGYGLNCGYLTGFGQIGDPVDIDYWQSLYYDALEDNLYWSRFNMDDDVVEMIMVQGVWTEDPGFYSVGKFADKVWPVGGLIELEAPAISSDTGDSAHHTGSVEIIREEKTAIEPIVRKAADNVEAAPVRRPADTIQKTVTEVTVEIRADELSKNGQIFARVPVTATLVSTSSDAMYTAEFYGYDGEPVPQEMIDAGAFYIYKFAFVDPEGIPAGEPILTMKFAMGSTGTLVIYTDDINEDDEQLTCETVILGTSSATHNIHTYEAEWEWRQVDNGDLTAVATLNCSLGDDAPEIILNAEVTKEAVNGGIAYTATVELDGKTFTDTYVLGTAQINGKSANFGEELGVNFLLVLSDALAQDENAYAVVTFNGEDEEYILSECVSGERFKVTKTFAVKEFSDDMTIHVYNGDGFTVPLCDKQGNDFTANGYSYSMLDYINRIIETSTNEKMIALAKGFFDYGKAAAVKFNYSNGQHLEVGYYNDFDDVTAEDLADFAPVYNSKSLETVVKDTASANYTSKLVLNKFFIFEEGTDVSEYKFYVNDHEVDAEKVNDTKYKVSFTGIAIKNFDEAIKFTVSDGQNTYEVEYSVLSYAYRTLCSETATDQMVDLAKAMYYVYVAADEYFPK
ncbi:MAG: S8 family serine peptidase [Clostridia bacterium]|nr:S8 family serine peptidase [Clostridia bacterium]